jgi:hypothetical protein
MKPVQSYSKEALSKLKQWIGAMNARGTEQYYEIFVDVTKVVHKTNDVVDFESYLTWVDKDTQLIRVLTYNTKGSHRAKVYEYRTEKFVEKINYKEQVEILQSTNEELLKRIADAEEHIGSLEVQLEQQSKKPGFDIESIISSFSAFAKQNPALLGRLGGLGEMLQTNPANNEDSLVSFKRKASNGFVKTQNEGETVSTFSTEGKLSAEQEERINDVIKFFVTNPDYIGLVHELVTKESQQQEA